MDITRGSFQDFPKKRISSSHSTRSNSHLANDQSVPNSFEFLPPEFVESTDNEPFDKDDPVQDFINEDEKIDKLISKKMKEKVDGDDDKQNGEPYVKPTKQNGSSDNAKEEFDFFDDELGEENEDLKKAYRKMRRLDELLGDRMKKEKEVKRQRLLQQKSVYEEMEKMKADSNNYKPTKESKANTMKYLALLPPKQQLDVLIKRNESQEDIDPIFPTQPIFPDDQEKSTRPSSANESSKSNDGDTSSRKPSSARSSSRKSNEKKKDKVDFIKRNIELAKDAGEYVSMTPDEKERLSKLLEDIDEYPDDESEAGSSLPLMTLTGEGYSLLDEEKKRMLEIDEKLHGLTPAFSLNNSLSPQYIQDIPASWRNDEIVESKTKISKSNLTETLNPSDRMKNIEEKLQNLDEKWKAEFDNDEDVRLDNDVLQRLLEECTNASTSRSSLTFQSEDDLSSMTSSHVSMTASSIHNDDIESWSEESTVSIQPKLSREVLDNLLEEARSCLGIREKLTEENSEPDSDTETDDSLVESVKEVNLNHTIEDDGMSIEEVDSDDSLDENISASLPDQHLDSILDSDEEEVIPAEDQQQFAEDIVENSLSLDNASTT